MTGEGWRGRRGSERRRREEDDSFMSSSSPTKVNIAATLDSLVYSAGRGVTLYALSDWGIVFHTSNILGRGTRAGRAKTREVQETKYLKPG